MLACEQTPRTEEDDGQGIVRREAKTDDTGRADAGASVKEVAQRYGINRNTLHEHINRAVKDPEGQWREAEEEASFRRKVYELLR